MQVQFPEGSLILDKCKYFTRQQQESHSVYSSSKKKVLKRPQVRNIADFSPKIIVFEVKNVSAEFLVSDVTPFPGKLRFILLKYIVFPGLLSSSGLSRKLKLLLFLPIVFCLHVMVMIQPGFTGNDCRSL